LALAANACAPARVPPAHGASSGLPASASGAAIESAAPPFVRPATPDAAFRATAPRLADLDPFPLPPVRAFRLSNGLRVLLFENHTVGLVRTELMLRARPAPLGANHLAAKGVRLGTPAMPPVKINEADDADAAQLSVLYGWGWIRVTTTAPTDRAASSVARLATVAIGASLPERDVAQLTADVANALALDEDAPRTIAARVLPLALYGLKPSEGDDDPAALRSADVEAITRAQIVAAYQAALEPTSAALVVSGDTTEQAVRPLLEKAFGAWRAAKTPGPAAWPIRKSAAGASSPRIVVVDHPGPESYLLFGGEGPAYGSADWAAMVLLRKLLVAPHRGIAEALRDTKPLFTTLDLNAVPTGPRVMASTSVATARAADALVALDGVLRGAKTMQVAPSEFDDVYSWGETSLLSCTASVQAGGGMLEGVVVQGLDRGLPAKMVGRFHDAGPVDLLRVAETYLDPSHMKVIVVGDWAKLKPELVGLGWGPIEVRSAAGVVMSVVPAKGP
jgi:predicted Zn-dependent peptidase